MKRLFALLLICLLLILSACSPIQRILQLVQPSTEMPAALTESIPAATEPPAAVTATEEAAQPAKAYSIATLPASILSEAANKPDTYWVTNPTSGVKLFVQVVHAKNWDGKPKPAVVLIPGGTGSGGSMLQEAKIIAATGFTVLVFDPDGRGLSQGSEDFDGFIHQDGLAAIIRFAQELPAVEGGKVGLISFSYGVTMATGVLARYPQLGVPLYIDWEGPVDRYDTTTTPSGECKVDLSKQGWHACDDEEYWFQREAIHFMAQVKVPAYQRVQSEKDHVQPDVTHAIRIINQAVAAGIGWVRLNDLPINQTYDVNNPPQMVPENLDKTRDQRIADYAKELMSLFGG